MPDTTFRAEFRRDGDREILAVSGALDFRSVFALWGALEFVPENEHIVIDCADVASMDRRGLRTIVIQRQRRARSGGTLAIRRP
jgi:anti-anti-sigma regulatory factor